MEKETRKYITKRESLESQALNKMINDNEDEDDIEVESDDNFRGKNKTTSTMELSCL